MNTCSASVLLLCLKIISILRSSTVDSLTGFMGPVVCPRCERRDYHCRRLLPSKYFNLDAARSDGIKGVDRNRIGPTGNGLGESNILQFRPGVLVCKLNGLNPAIADRERLFGGTDGMRVRPAISRDATAHWDDLR